MFVSPPRRELGYLTLLLLNSVACEYPYAVLLNMCGFYSTFNMDTLHRIVKFLFCFVKQDRFPLISPNPKPRGLGLTLKSSLTNIVYENMSSSQSVVSIYLLLFIPCLVCFASISVKRSVLVCFATRFY